MTLWLPVVLYVGIISTCDAFSLYNSGFLRFGKLHYESSVKPFKRPQIAKNFATVRSISGAVNDASLVPHEQISSSDLSQELQSAFMSYSMSTILSRALPDIRDGMKPVHRRLLYAMHELRLGPESSFRKCARIVGEVLGKFHPHGDQSVYEALVRMAQEFVMLHPLIRGHGNFGSVDDDPPAAMRYTEAKLSRLAQHALLDDIREGTVDFLDNFDGSEQEPCVFPARLPMLLLNGASGIAVGMATNVPPHNLGELADAMIAMTRNSSVTSEELSQIVLGPDFPTGGEIVGHKGCRDFHGTGHGSILMRAKIHEEEHNKHRSLVVTELPYLTNKALLLEKLASAVNEKKLEGISDLRDESDRDGLRIVIELKRDARPDVVKHNLFQQSQLQSSFSGNFVALVANGTMPVRLSLRESLQHFLQFRFSIVRRRTAHQLHKLRERAHVVTGLLHALAHIDGIVTALRAAGDTQQAQQTLTTSFQLTEAQADAVLSLTLRRLTSLEKDKLAQEEKELARDIATAETLMTSDDAVRAVIIAETEALKSKFAVPRRTKILDDGEAQAAKEAVVTPNTAHLVVLTEQGYLKRLSLDDFDNKRRGAKGQSSMRAQDSVAQSVLCRAHDGLLLVSNQGMAHHVEVDSIPIASRAAKGAPLPQFVKTKFFHERITAIVPASNNNVDNSNMSIVLVTKQGMIKRSNFNSTLKSINHRKKCGVQIMSVVSMSDEVGWVKFCQPGDELMIATQRGYCGRFPVDTSVRTTSRKTQGVRALRLRDKDFIADVGVVAGDEQSKQGAVVVVTARGMGKRVKVDSFPAKRRGGRGITASRFKSAQGQDSEQSDRVVAFKICGAEDDVLLTTAQGRVLRQSAEQIPFKTRSSAGVRMQDVSPDDSVIKVDVVPHAFNEE